jgi:hypothetical protein
MEENYSIEVNATKGQIEDFKESVLWQDICRELNFWAEGFKGEEDSIVDRIASDNLSTPATLTLLGSIDGRKKAVTYFKQILDVFLNVLEEKENDSERERTE